MSPVIITCITSSVLAGALVWLKVVEVNRGRRVFLPHARDLVDRLVETVPVALSREIRLTLARLSLKGHGFSTSVHDATGSARTFFRRKTIKLFASVNTGQEVSEKKHTSFWEKFLHRKSNLTRE